MCLPHCLNPPTSWPGGLGPSGIRQSAFVMSAALDHGVRGGAIRLCTQGVRPGVGVVWLAGLWPDNAA
jgi:hypothetical protein